MMLSLSFHSTMHWGLNVWNVIGKKFINQLSNSQIFGFHLFDDVTVKASDNCPTNYGKGVFGVHD